MYPGFNYSSGNAQQSSQINYPGMNYSQQPQQLNLPGYHPTASHSATSQGASTYLYGYSQPQVQSQTMMPQMPQQTASYYGSSVSSAQDCDTKMAQIAEMIRSGQITEKYFYMDDVNRQAKEVFTRYPFFRPSLGKNTYGLQILRLTGDFKYTYQQATYTAKMDIFIKAKFPYYYPELVVRPNAVGVEVNPHCTIIDVKRGSILVNMQSIKNWENSSMKSLSAIISEALYFFSNKIPPTKLAAGVTNSKLAPRYDGPSPLPDPVAKDPMSDPGRLRLKNAMTIEYGNIENSIKTKFKKQDETVFFDIDELSQRNVALMEALRNLRAETEKIQAEIERLPPIYSRSAAHYKYETQKICGKTPALPRNGQMDSSAVKVKTEADIDVRTVMTPAGKLSEELINRAAKVLATEDLVRLLSDNKTVGKINIKRYLQLQDSFRAIVNEDTMNSEILDREFIMLAGKLADKPIRK